MNLYLAQGWAALPVDQEKFPEFGLLHYYVSAYCLGQNKYSNTSHLYREGALVRFIDVDTMRAGETK
jgi:hypothetical protein